MGYFRHCVMCLALAVAASAPAAAEPAVEAPKITSGDSWTYENTKEIRGKWQQTHDAITVERVSTSSMIIGVKAVGSDRPPGEQLIGTTWSRSRNVNGRQTVVSEPVAFPLSPGKSWTVDYTETNPNRFHTREQVHLVYEVKGWEDVTVPAGTFKAIKVEADGDWAADVPARTVSALGSDVNATGAIATGGTIRQGPQTLTGHLYKVVWYVPELDRWAKSVEETFDPNGIRSERFTAVLLSYALKDRSHS